MLLPRAAGKRAIMSTVSPGADGHLDYSGP
jgi:hypothetical protein